MKVEKRTRCLNSKAYVPLQLLPLELNANDDMVNQPVFRAYVYGKPPPHQALGLKNPRKLTNFPGTSFWYALRGLCRIVDPIRVSEWFRPPAQPVLQPSGKPKDSLKNRQYHQQGTAIVPHLANDIAPDLELYNIWTDGWQLITLAILLTTLSGAVPLPGATSDSRAKKPYARAAVWATIFHHVTTAYGAYQHWVKPTHYTAAMAIGVWANVFLTVAGFVALFFGLGEGGKVANKRS